MMKRSQISPSCCFDFCLECPASCFLDARLESSIHHRVDFLGEVTPGPSSSIPIDNFVDLFLSKTLFFLQVSSFTHPMGCVYQPFPWVDIPLSITGEKDEVFCRLVLGTGCVLDALLMSLTRYQGPSLFPCLTDGPFILPHNEGS